MKFKSLIVLSFVIFTNQYLQAQQTDEVNWISFQELEIALVQEPKKVFIDFYADWCVYCKKMDKATFKDSRVISKLNTDYYAVKMNAETNDTISFGGETYTNREVGKSRTPTHDIPKLLASRENRPFSLPALIILNEKFEVEARYFRYLSPNELNTILNEY